MGMWFAGLCGTDLQAFLYHFLIEIWYSYKAVHICPCDCTVTCVTWNFGIYLQNLYGRPTLYWQIWGEIEECMRWQNSTLQIRPYVTCNLMWLATT